MKLYGNRGGKYAPQRAKRKKRRLRKGAVVLILLFITVVLTVGALAFRHIRPPETGETPPVSDVSATASQEVEETPVVDARKEDFVTILLIARYLLDVPMSGGLGGIVTLSIIYLILSLALGLLVSVHGFSSFR